MVPRVRTRATTAILPLRGTSRVPKVRPPLLLDQPPAAPDISKQATRSVVYRALPRSLTLAIRPETDASLQQFSFADTRSHSPTTLAHESITHTSPIGTPILSMPKPGMHVHRPLRLAFFRFPTCQPWLINSSRFSIAFRHIAITF